VPKNRDWERGDLVYIPQGCTLEEKSDQTGYGFYRTGKPELGMVIDSDTPNKYIIFCMGRVLVAPYNQVHCLWPKKG